MMDLLLSKKKEVNFEFFINRCSNSLERLLFHSECQQNGFLKSMYLLSRKACLLTRRLPNTFSWCILPKTKS